MGLTREQILNSADSRIEQVDVPEWGGTCFIKVMSGVEREEMEALSFEDGKPVSGRRFASILLAKTVCDESGELLFGADDIAALGKKNALVVERVAKEASLLNGLGKAAKEELEKN